MRPVTLHLEGFGAFREPATLSFEGVDYFALVGPTGAGKSTVIDALCFALYGSIPRYGDERLVGRAVSVGKQEAKVSLTFDVGDHRYRATRVVRIRNGKATTPEAVLERCTDGDASELLASSARDMKPAVEHLLGLPFAHFIKCVVLPQGEFARFLHDDPAKRRELLSRILDSQVYDRVGQRARERAAEAEGAVALQDQQLSELAFATVDTRAAAQERVTQLRDLYKQVDAARAEDEQLAALATVTIDAQAAEGLAAALGAVAVPDDLGSFTADLEALRASAAQAHANREAAATALRGLDERVESQPDLAPLSRARDAHDAIERLAPELEVAASALARAHAALEAATVAAQRCEQELVDAQDALAARRDAHAAHALAANLVAGEPCPVCAQEVTSRPKRKKPAALAGAERAVTAARTHSEAARSTLNTLAGTRAAAAGRAEQLMAQLAQHQVDIAAYPDRDALNALLAEHHDATNAHVEGRKREQAARAAEAEAAAALQQLEVRRAQWSEELARVREAFVRAALDPPRPSGDLAGDWAAFAAWAAAGQAAQSRVAADASARIAALGREQTALVGSALESARRFDVAPGAEGLRELQPAVIDRGTEAATDLRRIDDALDTATKLREQVAAAREERDVAELLGSLMRSDRFQNWFLAEAIELLAASASTTLFALSAGQYSLSYGNDNEFVVVDHRNADETRSVRTLSGGETFQAALALALALSDQLAELSAAGGAKLDAIFLDEGFGTLDADTLEVVAGTIEALGTSGRMVGVVTHVPALADRVPVRYRVNRTDRGAEVTREET